MLISIKYHLKAMACGLSILALFAAISIMPRVAGAIPMTLQTANNVSGNQAFSGVGVRFSVNSAVTVSELGIFDSNQDGIAAPSTAPLSAYLLNNAGGVVASITFDSTSPGTLDAASKYRFKPITTVTLPPGIYILVGYGWTVTDPEHNCNSNVFVPCETFNTGGGLLSFINAPFGFGSDAPGTLPGRLFGGVPPGCTAAPCNFFSAANMKFDALISEVDIDIKPGSDLNTINMCSMGVIPIAIFGSDTFDVADIDVSKLRLGDGTPGGGSAIKMVGKAQKELCSTEDIDLDGFYDLECKFVTIDLDLAEGATEAMVLGTTIDGDDFIGTDSVEITKFCD